MNTNATTRNDWNYTRPGVYLETAFDQPRQDPFTTGVPVFIGLCRQVNPENKLGQLQRLTLWSHFRTYVGTPDKDCRLAYAVRGFFQNGGGRCYVIVVPELEAQILLDALHQAAKFRSIDLVCVPDLGDSREEAVELQQMIVTHCDEAGDRFAILDSWLGDQPTKVAEVWSKIVGTNGALYYPWVHVSPIEDDPTSTSGVLVPPCGHIAGVYARTDQNRGVHKAPANEVLEGVLKLERVVTHVKHEEEGPGRVNCIRSFPGRGIRVWGARSISGNDAWTYVNVRRLFLTAIRWLEWHMKGVVFEPNDPKLWARIEGELHQYFLSLYRQGALKGATAEEAYYVKCNQSNNPREVIDAGQVVAEIGLAAAIPFEFVVVRLVYGTSGVSISGLTRPEQNS